MFKTLQLTEDNGVAWLSLNRPDKHNAMNLTMIHELIALARHLSKRRDIIAVVISGEGPSFCAGMDLAGIFSRPRDKFYAFTQLLRPTQGIFQRVNLIWRQLPMPVIALVHGHCYGAGLQLALGADWVFAHRDSHLSLMEGKWGMVPDMGATVTLRGRLAPDIAKELMCTARILDATTAQSLGLVSHVHDDPKAAVINLLNELRLRSPDAVAATKRLVDRAWLSGAWRSLLTERYWQIRLLLGKNHAIAVTRNRKKSETPFHPRGLL